MTAIRPTVETTRQFQVLSKTKRHHQESIRRALHLIGSASVKDIKRRLTTGSRHGRIYPYNKLVPGASPQASAPGEFPGWVTRRLANSIIYTVNGAQEVIVGTSVKYGGYLEAGTERMAARPYLAPTAERFAGQLAARLRKQGIKILEMSA